MEIALSLLGFAKDTIAWIIKFVQPKIDVKPEKLKINKTEWNKEGYFTVCNKTDSPLFDLQVLLWFQTDNTSAPSLLITKIDDQEKGNEVKNADVTISTEAFIVKGIIKNKEVLLVQLHFLAPRECKRIFFIIQQQSEGNIALQAIGASINPSQFLSSDRKVAIPFTPPRDITVSSISLFMKKY